MKNLILTLMIAASFQAVTAQADDCKPGRVFNTCVDQTTLYEQGLARAKAAQKPLVVLFGFESCGWCQSLHKIFSDPQFTAGKDFEFVQIAAYDKGEKLPSGIAVLLGVLDAAGQDRKSVQGFPFLEVIRPSTAEAGQKLEAFPKDTGLLEENTMNEAGKVTKAGHSRAKVEEFLYEARRSLGY
ncbi:DUF255 domain-containing protein [bacterium]|jgi:thioredoxin-like negative regulator of GroEL|nr:DUF255 domain-containing protein [bacterium]